MSTIGRTCPTREVWAPNSPLASVGTRFAALNGLEPANRGGCGPERPQNCPKTTKTGHVSPLVASEWVPAHCYMPGGTRGTSSCDPGCYRYGRGVSCCAVISAKAWACSRTIHVAVHVTPRSEILPHRRSKFTAGRCMCPPRSLIMTAVLPMVGNNIR